MAIYDKRGGSISSRISHYHDTPRPRCQALLIAVIERAVRDALSSQVKSHIHREARLWLDAPSIAPWSFLWCVTNVGWSICDASKIRKLIGQVDTLRFLRGPSPGNKALTTILAA